MNIELLFAFRALHKVTRIAPQQTLQAEYLNKSYRKILISKLATNVVAKYLYFVEMFRLFLFMTLRETKEGEDFELIYLSVTANQARQIDYMRSVFPDRDYICINIQGNKRFRFRNILRPVLYFKCFCAGLRYYRAFFDRHNCIDFKNHIMFICMYVYAKQALKDGSPRALLVANDHSPIPLGFACAARSLGMKTLYIQHAHVTADMPYLRFDLAILDGECALDIYKKEGSTEYTKIVYRGLEGEQRDMDTTALSKCENLTVGVFVNVFMDEQLYKILDALLKNTNVDKIILREHPAFPLNLPDEKIPDRVFLSERGISLWDDAKRCDVIIGGNSSFHLLTLKFGIPTIFYDEMDFVNYDDYRFIENNIVYEAKDLHALDYKDVGEYYDDPKWGQRFQYYDAGYKQNQSLLIKDTRVAIEKLIKQQLL